MKLTVFLTFLLLLLVGFANGQTQITAIKAGKLVNPSTSTTLTNQVILVEGKKIKAIGEGLQIPSVATVIDLSNSTVMPGLFDAHTHLCARSRIEADRLGVDFLDLVLLDPAGYRAIQGVVYARQMLDAGFTTVRDVGNAGKYVDVDLQRGINEGLVPGPTMIVAGRIIAPFGGQFRTRAEKHVLENPEYFFADTRDEIRKAIRENIYYGANVIKIVVDGQRYSYSLDDIKFIVDEATRANVKVAAHCQTKTCERNAAEAGVASIEHGWFFEEAETAELMKKNNVTLVSTDFSVKVLQGFGWNETRAKEINLRRVNRLKRVRGFGVNVAFGTDIMVDVEGETRGTLALGYIDSFVQAGYTSKEIFQIMTVNPARLLGVENQRGTLAVGMMADIIATTENPLDNIQTLKQVNFVMKDGKIHKPLK
ncbi:MAG: amidohydrolase family protein [Pyrinomonadaceae bacterium]|jgi:imidazolonepropionase-like amidohydrolase|nr:amidohydrolase family protein [Pyrinomonadaceae bacterium]